jgi:SAM-dependent methyltransferase
MLNQVILSAPATFTTRTSGAGAGPQARSGSATRPTTDPPGWDIAVDRLLLGTLLRPGWAGLAGWVDRLGLVQGARVLDFGSGSGQLSRRLALAVGPKGRVTCLDISPRWLEVARQEVADLPWVELHLGRPGDLPPAAYDLVHVHYVMHDVPRGHRGEAIEQLAARLKPGGHLALREPLYYGPLHMDELVTLFARAGMAILDEPARRWWLAGPVVEVFFRRETESG